MGLLRQFNILLDYSRREMILSKNSRKGPAWQAGPRSNQLILAINGVDTAEIDILTLREQLKDPRYKKMVVLVKDDSRTGTPSIYLKDLVLQTEFLGL